MMLMGMEDGMLGVAKVAETHLVCVYAEVSSFVVVVVVVFVIIVFACIDAT